MAVVNMTVGANTDDGATFAVKVDDGPVRVMVADNPAMDGGTFFGPESVDSNGAAKVTATGLQPRTRYWWQVEDDGNLDATVTGQFITLPTEGSQASFTVGFATCAGLQPVTPGVGDVLAADRLSNHAIFDTIRQRALSESWLGFWHGGDLHYYDLGSGNHGISGGASLANYRRAIDDVLAQPNQHRLYREVPWWHVWDDHDYGPNDSDGTHSGKGNAAQVMRERFPLYPLSDPDGIWQAWTIGRVLFIASDVRYYRDPNDDPDGPSKTMLGSAQKAWMQGLLESSPAAALCWLMPSQWLRTDGADTWASFATERAELIDMFSSTTNQFGHPWSRVMWMANGDRHALGMDSGSQPFGRWPVLLAASLDSNSGLPMDGVFDSGPDFPGRQRYGTITVDDLGSFLRVTLTGWIGTEIWRSYTFGVLVDPDAPSQAVATVQELAPIVAGSHTPVAEARILTAFQTGHTPDGVEVGIIDGDVQYDATAEVFATVSLTIPGVDPVTGRPRFPRQVDDLLAPYGNELFLRLGVDIGSSVLRVPMGYFRIESVEQDGDAESPISISGSDRMAALLEARVMRPREYGSQVTVAALFADLIGDVYPQATVAFDDEAGFSTLGRTMVVDETRYEPLLEVAAGLGKVFYVDGEGVFRVESEPDETVPVWQVNAGRGGVAVSTSRRVSRIGAVNAVVFDGESGDLEEPVRGIAVDAGPMSPTRFGGRFGRVPRFHASPFVRTVLQAQQAAAAMLRRNLGLPYSVDFGALTNAALRPRMPIRVVHSDGSRELHVVEQLTIPVSGSMQGTTRERTHVTVRTVVA